MRLRRAGLGEAVVDEGDPQHAVQDDSYFGLD